MARRRSQPFGETDGPVRSVVLQIFVPTVALLAVLIVGAVGYVQAYRLQEVDAARARHASVGALEGPGAEPGGAAALAIVARERRAWAGAAAAAIVALAVGAAATGVVARSFARRLEALARAARAVASGDILGCPSIRDRGPRDEIRVASDAFDAMLTEVRGLLCLMHYAADTEHRRLEALVEARTRTLDERNRDLRRVLGAVGQGFVTLDRDGVMSEERSAILDAWLGEPARGSRLADVLRRHDERAADWLDVGWEYVWDGALPWVVVVEQLPRSFEVGGRTLSVDYRPIDDGGRIDRVLLVVTDDTARRAHERAEEENRELTRLFTALVTDPRGVADFVAETDAHLEALATATEAPAVLRRRLHTLKGTSGVMGLSSVARLAHEAEDRLDAGEPLADAVRPLMHLAEARLGAVRPVLAARDGVDVSPREIDEAVTLVAQGASAKTIRFRIDSWKRERLRPHLERLAAQARGIARRLGEPEVRVLVESDGARLPSGAWAPFWGAAVHLVRNAVDHGIESREERAARGKDPTPTVTITGGERGGRLVVEITDDGRGVDWDRVAHRARERGLPAATRADLERALFADGLSTKAEVTEISGRGVGLAAVRAACDALGGSSAVASEAGRGTTFRFEWPAEAPPSSPPLSEESAPAPLAGNLMDV